MTKWLLVAALVAAAAAAAIGATGGTQVHAFGVRLSLIDPTRALVAAGALLAIYAVFWRQRFRGDAADLAALLRARPWTVALALAVVAFAAALHWGSTVAAGADSYGYVSQAMLWRKGHLVQLEPMVDRVPWPGADRTFAPLGYRPWFASRDNIVPLYPPGLPLLMAVGQIAAGFCGAFLVVPLSGAAVVWLTFALGRRIFRSAAIGLWAAVLVGSSPIFLYQLMNPMSDVPVTAAWTLALLLACDNRWFACGLAMTIAVAIRPNLVPLAGVVLVWSIIRADSPHRLRAPLLAIAGLAPAVVGVAWLNARLYGSPLLSGYGSAEGLYALEYFRTNAIRYSTWLVETETPAIALALVFFAAPRLTAPAEIGRPRFLLGATIAVVVLSYLFYLPFEAWWYLRFLVPMWPPLMLATAAAIGGVANLVTPRFSRFVASAAIAALAWHGVDLARDRAAFTVGEREQRYVDVARLVDSYTDQSAVVFSMQNSGSVRLYSGRLTLRYDQLESEWLDRAVEYLASIGRHPFFLLDPGEIDAFRQRFQPASRLGALDWPPIARLRGSTALYDPFDRDAARIPIIVARRPTTESWPCAPAR